MESQLVWDETKRAANLAKHGLDFCDAHEVLNSLYRLDVAVLRGAEIRTQSFSYVFNCLHVLTVVHLDREGLTRVISYRPASGRETEKYYAWLDNEFNDA